MTSSSLIIYGSNDVINVFVEKNKTKQKSLFLGDRKNQRKVFEYIDYK
jgi:hypothetical protein